MPESYLETNEILMEAMKDGALSYQGHHFQLDGCPFDNNRPEFAGWTAANGANIASVGSASFVRRITDVYRTEEGYSTSTDGQPSFADCFGCLWSGKSANHAYSLAARLSNDGLKTSNTCTTSMQFPLTKSATDL